MPPLLTAFTAVALDPAALVLALAAAIGYGLGLRGAARHGERWPIWRALCFYALGIVPYLVLTCGFTGAYGPELRWAFTLKLALTFFVVPLLAGLGRPLGLTRAALGEDGRRRLDAVMASRPMRLLGNAFVAPILGLVLFGTFLTPLLHTYRADPVASGLLSFIVPLLGLVLVLPIVEGEGFHRSSSFILLEFVYVFIELLADAVPGIALRLNDSVLDKVTSWPAGAPSWFPSPLRDQQLAGDILWFIAEIVDLPLIILMFVRFSRNDRHEAKSFDDLSDEEMDALTEAHLRQRGE
ncbi:cytochrome c oxidase assembly protein [Sinomonas sp. G460-2]|uniref:cytochrome c oxidase assembly protein n=1 Tax=Sinomonas sp. G460-2 TaxID=3393464 RepID=UPI0039EE37FE